MTLVAKQLKEGGWEQGPGAAALLIALAVVDGGLSALWPAPTGCVTRWQRSRRPGGRARG